MKLLITGTSGFIGRNLKEYFEAKKEYEVKCPKHSELDLLNEQSVQDYLREGKFDVVIHSANINTSRNKSNDAYASLDGNLRMFLHLHKCRHLYGKMFYFGSGAEYDREHYIPFMKEEYFGEHVPTDHYGLSKYVMSRMTDEGGNIYDFRLYGVYGLYEEWERRFISNAIIRAKKGMDITLQKHMYFDYLWAGDLCRIMEYFLMHEPKENHYNVCRGEHIDLYELAEMVKKETGSDSPIVVGAEGFKPEYSGDNSKMLKELGNFSFTPYEETIKELIAYYEPMLDEIDTAKLV